MTRSCPHHRSLTPIDVRFTCCPRHRWACYKCHEEGCTSAHKKGQPSVIVCTACHWKGPPRANCPTCRHDGVHHCQICMWWSPHEMQHCYVCQTCHYKALLPGICTHRSATPVLRAKDMHSIQRIGAGNFSVVYRAAWEDRTVAIKVPTTRESSKDAVVHEARFLRGLAHCPHVIRVLGTAVMNGSAALVMEYAANGCLLDHLVSETDLPRLRIVRRVARAMDICVRTGILHRDLAARNVLLDDKFSPLLADFGLSRRMNKELYMSARPTARAWMPPEALHGAFVHESCDVWSFGVLMWEVYSRPYATPSEAVGVESTLRRPQLATDAVWAVMRRCWDPDPQARPKFAELVRDLA